MAFSQNEKIQAGRRLPFTVRAVDSMEVSLARLDNKISQASSRRMRFNQGTLTPWPEIRASVYRTRDSILRVVDEYQTAYTRAAEAGRVERRPDLGLGIEPVTLAIAAVLAAAIVAIIAYMAERTFASQAQAEAEMAVTQAQIRAFETAVDQQIELFNRRNPTPAPTPPGSPPTPAPPVVPVPPIVLPPFPSPEPRQPAPREPGPGEQIERAAGGLAVLAFAAAALFLLPKLIRS